MLEKLRQQPSNPLLAMLSRKLKGFDEKTAALGTRKGDFVMDKLQGLAVVPGSRQCCSVLCWFVMFNVLLCFRCRFPRAQLLAISHHRRRPRDHTQGAQQVSRCLFFPLLLRLSLTDTAWTRTAAQRNWPSCSRPLSWTSKSRPSRFAFAFY